MDDLRILVELNGFFTRGQARELGYDDRNVANAVRHGIWHRFRRGYYTFTDTWAALEEVGRHAVRSAAVLHSLGPQVALSHVSGLVAHGISVWGMDLRRVHVTRLDGAAGRIEGDVVHHEGFCLDSDVVDVPGGKALVPVRCALEAGSRNGGGEVALAALDNLLHARHCTEEELHRQFELMQFWPFMRMMHVPVRMADGRSASVGESRGLWLFRVHRLPAPELQYAVHHPATGELIGTTDWAWPEHRTLGEFDGEVKYGRLLQPGMEPGQVVFAEKQREDALREATDFTMVRLVWNDYERPRTTADRLRRKLFPRAAGD